MRRVAHPYMAWEDYLAGMYGESDTPSGHTDDAFELLTDVVDLKSAMRRMLVAWPTAAEHWLTRPGAKSRAWLGAAACMFEHGAPERCTRAAWWLLTSDQQDAANAAADEIRTEWLADREADTNA
jgi:hypothetical protein